MCVILLCAVQPLPCMWGKGVERSFPPNRGDKKQGTHARTAGMGGVSPHIHKTNQKYLRQDVLDDGPPVGQVEVPDPLVGQVRVVARLPQGEVDGGGLEEVFQEGRDGHGAALGREGGRVARTGG